MPILKRETLSGQVASILEKGISSGKYAPGSRLPSTRDLASSFNVSQQVLKSAVELMEAKSLVVRRSRDGIYVNPHAFAPKRLEYALLSNSRQSHVFDYASALLSVGSPALWSGINLSSRIIPASDCEAQTLSYELERIKDAKPDCLIAFISINEERLERFKGLPFPAVFLGDFPWETDESSPWNQIIENTSERAESMAEAAASAGAKSMALVGGTLDKHYARQLCAAGKAKAKALGIAFRYLEFSDGTCNSREELAKARSEFVKGQIAKDVPDALALDGFIDLELFSAPLEKAGIRPGRDIHIINDKELSDGGVFLKPDYSEFSRAAMKLIGDLAEGRVERFGRRLFKGLVKRTPIFTGLQTLKRAV